MAKSSEMQQPQNRGHETRPRILNRHAYDVIGGHEANLFIALYLGIHGQISEQGVRNLLFRAQGEQGGFSTKMYEDLRKKDGWVTNKPMTFLSRFQEEGLLDSGVHVITPRGHSSTMYSLQKDGPKQEDLVAKSVSLLRLEKEMQQQDDTFSFSSLFKDGRVAPRLIGLLRILHSFRQSTQSQMAGLSLGDIREAFKQEGETVSDDQLRAYFRHFQIQGLMTYTKEDDTHYALARVRLQEEKIPFVQKFLHALDTSFDSLSPLEQQAVRIEADQLLSGGQASFVKKTLRNASEASANAKRITPTDAGELVLKFLAENGTTETAAFATLLDNRSEPSALKILGGLEQLGYVGRITPGPHDLDRGIRWVITRKGTWKVEGMPNEEIEKKLEPLVRKIKSFITDGGTIQVRTQHAQAQPEAFLSLLRIGRLNGKLLMLDRLTREEAFPQEFQCLVAPTEKAWIQKDGGVGLKEEKIMQFNGQDISESQILLKLLNTVLQTKLKSIYKEFGIEFDESYENFPHAEDILREVVLEQERKQQEKQAQKPEQAAEKPIVVTEQDAITARRQAEYITKNREKIRSAVLTHLDDGTVGLISDFLEAEGTAFHDSVFVQTSPQQKRLFDKQWAELLSNMNADRLQSDAASRVIQHQRFERAQRLYELVQKAREFRQGKHIYTQIGHALFQEAYDPVLETLLSTLILKDYQSLSQVTQELATHKGIPASWTERAQQMKDILFDIAGTQKLELIPAEVAVLAILRGSIPLT